MGKLINRCREDPELFHALIFEPEKVLGRLPFLTPDVKRQILGLAPAEITAFLMGCEGSTFAQAQGGACDARMEAGTSVCCETTAGCVTCSNITMCVMGTCVCTDQTCGECTGVTCVGCTDQTCGQCTGITCGACTNQTCGECTGGTCGACTSGTAAAIGTNLPVGAQGRRGVAPVFRRFRL